MHKQGSASALLLSIYSAPLGLVCGLRVDNKVFMMHWGTAIEHNHSLDSALVVTPIHTELSEHFQQFLRLCS